MFLRNVIYTFSAEVFNLFSNLLIGILLARSLPVEERGILVLVMTLPYTIVNFANLGLPQAAIYFIGRIKVDARKVLGNSLTLALLTGLFSLLILLLLQPLILSTVLKAFPAEFWLPVTLLIPVMLVDAAALSVLRAHQRFDLVNLRQAANSLLLLLGFFFVLIGLQAGLQAVLWIYIAVSLLVAGLSLRFTQRVTPLSLTFDPALTNASLRYGMKSYLQNLVGSLHYRIDIYLLAVFLPPEQIAFYGVAVSLAEIAWYIPDSIGAVLFPRLSNTPLADIHQITARVARLTLLVTALAVLGLLSLGWFLLPLFYGAAYRASIVPLVLLLPGVLFMALYKVLTRNFSSRDRQQVSLIISGLALLLNVLMNLVLIPRLGVAGAALSSSVSYSLAAIILLVAYLKDANLPWQSVVLPHREDFSGPVNAVKALLGRKIRKVEVR